MNQSSTGHLCPACGGTNIESRGVRMTLFPTKAGGRGRRILECKFRCRDCSHEFSTKEEGEIPE